MIAKNAFHFIKDFTIKDDYLKHRYLDFMDLIHY